MLCSVYSLEILYKENALNTRLSYLCVPCEQSEKGMEFNMKEYLETLSRMEKGIRRIAFSMVGEFGENYNSRFLRYTK